LLVSSSGLQEDECRRRLQRSISRRGQAAELGAELVGAGDDHAPQLHERLAAHLDRAAAGEQQEPQRFPSLPGSRQGERLAGERCTGGADRVQLVVLATQPPLVAWDAADLKHYLAAAAQMTGEPGTVMACAFDRPDTPASRIELSKTQRLRVAACARTHRPLRDNDTGPRDDNREHMLIAMRVDTDHVIHLICKHPR
jgi:hypothetical protein